jgi:hypothetical protein
MARARKTHQKPEWPESSQARVDYFVSEFSTSLSVIAEKLARHEEAINVDPRHVNEAFGVINRLGQSRTPWWKRTELEVGAGGALFSLGLSCSEVVKAVLGSETQIVPWVMALLMVSGAVLVVHGWFRGKH